MNKNLFTIDESEKRRILEMHQGATKNQYIFEQTQGLSNKLTLPGFSDQRNNKFGHMDVEVTLHKPKQQHKEKPHLSGQLGTTANWLHFYYDCNEDKVYVASTTGNKLSDRQRNYINKFNNIDTISDEELKKFQGTEDRQGLFGTGFTKEAINDQKEKIRRSLEGKCQGA
jgi:hypothetical protein